MQVGVVTTLEGGELVGAPEEGTVKLATITESWVGVKVQFPVPEQ